MIPSTQLQKNRPWEALMAYSGVEFSSASLDVISGEIPLELRGSLYQNGAGLLERSGERIRHWFDGDGAVLGVRFADAGATGVYRYVQTDGYQAEEKAGRFLFGGYDRTPSGSLWQQVSLPVKNSANSGLLVLPDRLLALWGIGAPHALHRHTLKTVGLERSLGLSADAPYAVLPKIDPETGEIFNFGISYGPQAQLHLYRHSSTGKLLQKANHSLKQQPLIHDFALTQNYLIFFIPPVSLNVLPFLTKQKSFSQALSWKPNKGTQVLVIDRQTFSVVSRSTADTWFQWRFGNSCDDSDGSILTNIVCYPNFPDINQFLQEVLTGQTQTTAPGTLWQIRIDPQSAKVIEKQQLFDRGCEFPTTAPTDVGRPWRYTYLSVQRPDSISGDDLPGAIAQFDHQTGTLKETHFEENCWPSLPIYAPRPNTTDPGWILTVVFNGDCDRSELWIFDAAHLDHDPVCRLALLQVVPLGFQGIWAPTP